MKKVLRALCIVTLGMFAFAQQSADAKVCKVHRNQCIVLEVPSTQVDNTCKEETNNIESERITPEISHAFASTLEAFEEVGSFDAKTANKRFSKRTNVIFEDASNNPLKERLVLYNSNKTIKDDKTGRTLSGGLNQYSEDYFLNNFCKNGTKYVSPIATIPWLYFVQQSKGRFNNQEVFDYLGLERSASAGSGYNYYVSLKGLLVNSDVKIRTAIESKQEVNMLNDVFLVNFDEIYKRNERAGKDISNRIFKNDEKTKGLAFLSGVYPWEKPFQRIKGSYAFHNNDGSIVGARYIKGKAWCIPSDDNEAFRIIINHDTYIDIVNAGFFNKKHLFSKAPEIYEIVLPEISIHNYTTIMSMNVNGKGRIASFMDREDIGNFVLSTSFAMSESGLSFASGLQDILEKRRSEEEVLLGTPDLCFKSSFKIKIYYRGLLMLIGIVDAGDTFCLDK